MSAPYNVIWSDEALENIDSITSYLEIHWSQKEVDKFLEIVQEQERILSNFPKAYPISEKSGEYRRCVVTKQVSIIYKFGNEIVTINYVIDNRQDKEM